MMDGGEVQGEWGQSIEKKRDSFNSIINILKKKKNNNFTHLFKPNPMRVSK